MASSKELANRIKGIKDTKKITNAMYLISSTKMHRCRSSFEKTNIFFKTLKDEAAAIACSMDEINSIYFSDIEIDEDNTDEAWGILVITADKGLAGAYNQNVIKETMKITSAHKNSRLFVVGEYGRHYFMSHGMDIEEDFLFTAQDPSMNRARDITGHIMELYDSGDLKKVYIVYTDFKNGLESRVVSYRLVPFHRNHFFPEEKSRVTADRYADEPGADDVQTQRDIEYFPDQTQVLDNMIPMYCTGIVYSALADSYCSELNARMMAMDSANQNADDLIEELTKLHNRLRQDGITEEITEISGASRGLRKK